MLMESAFRLLNKKPLSASVSKENCCPEKISKSVNWDSITILKLRLTRLLEAVVLRVTANRKGDSRSEKCCARTAADNYHTLTLFSHPQLAIVYLANLYMLLKKGNSKWQWTRLPNYPTQLMCRSCAVFSVARVFGTLNWHSTVKYL